MQIQAELLNSVSKRYKKTKKVMFICFKNLFDAPLVMRRKQKAIPETKEN